VGEKGEGSPPNVETSLTPVIQAVLEKGEPPAQAAAEIVSEVRTVISRHRGPLPDPETLSAYNQLIPNGAERCMTLVERESAHRHAQEDRIVRTNLNLMVRGQYIGLGLVVLLAAAGVWLGLTGHDWLAGTVFTTTIVGVITVFVVGHGRGSDDNEDSDSTAETPSTTAQDRARQIALNKKKQQA
jgi:uncharacterized membrane protein